MSAELSLLQIREVSARVGLSVSMIYRLVAAGSLSWLGEVLCNCGLLCIPICESRNRVR